MSEKAKEELIDMGIDFFKTWISTSVGAATSVFATPIAGIVIQTGTSFLLEGTAECIKAARRGKSCKDITILRQATTAGIKQTINTGYLIGDIAIKATIDAGSTYSKSNSLPQAGTQGFKSVVKQVAPIAIDNTYGTAPVTKLALDIADRATSNVQSVKKEPEGTIRPFSWGNNKIGNIQT